MELLTGNRILARQPKLEDEEIYGEVVMVMFRQTKQVVVARKKMPDENAIHNSIKEKSDLLAALLGLYPPL